MRVMRVKCKAEKNIKNSNWDVFVIFKEASELIIIFVRDCWKLRLLLGHRSMCNVSSRLEQRVQFGVVYR